MLVAVVALSFKLHRVYFRHDPDPWLRRPRHFSRWVAPRPPLNPARPIPYISRPVPGKGRTA
jgi:hypothetical protein